MHNNGKAREIGYEYLRLTLKLSAFALPCPARIRPASKVTRNSEEISVPNHVAPQTSDPIEHLLFALKYEDINLQVIAQTMSCLSAAQVHQTIAHSPTSAYARLLGYFWESVTLQSLEDLPPLGRQIINVFDPERFITCPGTRDRKWRVAFNGIGSMNYSPIIRKTKRLDTLLHARILDQTNEYVAHLDREMTDRAISWAYLNETESSFAIEKEMPSHSDAQLFVRLLQQAHEKMPLTEDYLADLQSATMKNPLFRAAAFRNEQNWLANGLRGPAGVAYLPPAPELVSPLMSSLMEIANSAPGNLDPLLAASVVSFGFVFIHPFMDGNGRLSRFLFHHALCLSGQIKQGFLLPVSVAMKRNELEYLNVLKGYSKKARQLWDVELAGDEQFSYRFTGDKSIYQFWDATACAEFGLSMASDALNIDFHNEVAFLDRYDRIKRKIDDEYDLRGSDLSTLILSCLDNKGVLSKHRRKQFIDRVPLQTLDAIEQAAQEVLAEVDSDSAPTA